MKYSLKISQEAGGESNISFAEAEGRPTSDGGVEFFYDFDGAEYRLLLLKDKMTHTRLGDVSLEMNFVRGERSVCRISDGSNHGSFSIFTDELSVQFNGESVNCECVFSDGAGGEVTRIAVLAERI